VSNRTHVVVLAGLIAGVSASLGVALDMAFERRLFAATVVDDVSNEVRARESARADLEPVDLFASAGSLERRPFARLNPNASVNRAWLLAEGPFHVEGDGRRIVTLTFDDGPVPETTPNVLEALRECGVKASFFVLGQNLDKVTDRAELARGVLRHAVEEGHLVGNHTESHLYLPSLSHEGMIDEVEKGRMAIEQAIGKTTTLYRPPFGKLDEFGIAYAKERNLDLVLWNIEDGGDGLSDAVFERVRARIEASGGGIVLLHDSRATTANVVRKLCAWTKSVAWDPKNPRKLGYELVDLPTFLDETARSPQPFRDRAELELARAERGHPGAHVPRTESAEEPAAARDENLVAKRTKPRNAPQNDVRKVRHRPSRRR